MFLMGIIFNQTLQHWFRYSVNRKRGYKHFKRETSEILQPISSFVCKYDYISRYML